MLSITDLIHPMPVDEFFQEHWGRQTVHIPGAADKFAALYSLERFKSFFDKQPRSGAQVRAFFDETPEKKQLALHIASEEMLKAYEVGATICVTRLERIDPWLGAFCRKVKCDTGYIGNIGVNAYWSPGGSGLSPHFDRRVATSLQISGRKRWRFTKRPVVPWPVSNGILRDGKIAYFERKNSTNDWELEPQAGSLDEWEDVVLEPGDLLCVPAGAIHSAEGMGHSFALNLHFNLLETGKFVGELIDTAFADQAPWRHIPPILANGGVFGGPNPAAEKFLAERLDETIALMTRWRDNPRDLLVHAAAHLARDAAEEQAADAASTHKAIVVPDELGLEAEKEDALPLKVALLEPSPLLVVATPAADEVMVFFVGHQRIEASEEVAAVIRAALELGQFEDNLEVPGVEREEVRETVAALVEAGAFVRSLHVASIAPGISSDRATTPAPTPL